MKRSSTGIGSTQRSESAQSSSGELSPTQRAIKRLLSEDWKQTEADILAGLSGRLRKSLAAVHDDLVELETRSLAKCETSSGGRRYWTSVGEVA